MTKYYAAGGAKVVRQVPPGGGAGALTWLLADHLGTTVGALDGAGAVVATQRYWPYGAVRSGGVTQTDKLYTGQQAEPGDAALGLYNYKARFYSTTLGRFVSGDSVTDDGLNRYSYASNNPLRFRDPSGHCVRDANGQWMECSRATMIKYFYCAWDGECDASGFDESMVRTYAKGVVNTDAFRLFAQLESNARGDITLHYAYTGQVEDVLRYQGIPGRAIITGDFYMAFTVNATKRTIIDSYLEFAPNPRTNSGIDNPFCNGLFCVGPEKLLNFDGWDARTGKVETDKAVQFTIDAGPEGSYLGNPFSFFRDVDGVGVHLGWGAEFIDGNLVVNSADFRGVGSFGPIPFPFINLLKIEAEPSYYGY